MGLVYPENDFGDPLPPHDPDNPSPERETIRQTREAAERLFNDRRPQPEPKERKKPFRHTHILQPVGLDAWDPRPHPGSQVIPPGTPVKRIAQLGKGALAFHHVQDREGNTMSVWKGSLQPRQAKKPKPKED